MTDYSIDVVLIEYDEMWAAQCLQYDIGAQAKSFKDLVYELNRSLAGHVMICEEMGVEPFSNLNPAPAKYWKMWEGATVKVTIEDGARFRVPESMSIQRITN